MKMGNSKPAIHGGSWWFVLAVIIIVGTLLLPVFWIAMLFVIDVIWIKFGVRPQVVIVNPKEEQQKEQDKVQW